MAIYALTLAAIVAAAAIVDWRRHTRTRPQRGFAVIDALVIGLIIVIAFALLVVALYSLFT
jgi:hypothetical protein